MFPILINMADKDGRYGKGYQLISKPEEIPTGKAFIVIATKENISDNTIVELLCDAFNAGYLYHQNNCERNDD